MLVPIKIKPGIFKEGTEYSNQGGWFDCDKVRWRFQYPEKIGGWQKFIPDRFLGTCRSLFPWVNLELETYIGVGTNLKFYIIDGATVVDATPIRRTVTLGADPITTVNGSSIVTIHDVANGAIVNDFVTLSGATGFNGLAAGDINKEVQVLALSGADDYTVDLGVIATGSGAGGGAAVQAAYQINIGLNDTLFGTGWGAGDWGGVISGQTWGGAATVAVQEGVLRTWTQSNFGQDLIFNPRGGGIYYWSDLTPNARAINITALAGASDAPTAAYETFVSWQERQVFAFGTTPLGSSTIDPLWLRWSDAGNAAMWTPLATNSAGGLRISSGSFFVTFAQTHQEIVIFTDVSLMSLQFVGTPNIWGIFPIVAGVNIISPNAKVVASDILFWMGKSNFYRYDGHAQPIPCTIKDYVFSNINLNQSQKIWAMSMVAFNEVWWFYPSSNSNEIDRYVIYNYADNLWAHGTLVRTAGIDGLTVTNPMMTDTGTFIYEHEIGYDDGSTVPASPIVGRISSSPFEMDPNGGSHFMFANRLIPDVTFRDTGIGNPTVDFIFTPRDYPGAAPKTPSDSVVTRSVAVPVEQFTPQAWIRLRGRSMTMEVRNNTVGMGWRLGTPRLELRPDGRK
jgi:hypothetical protein